jgi:hypothetical protein
VGLTFRGIARLVVVGEPAEVFILDPAAVLISLTTRIPWCVAIYSRHPVLVLVLVARLDPLGIGLALLLVRRELVERLLLLVLAHSVPLACRRVARVLKLVGHGDV